MATKAYEEKEIELQDDTPLTLRPMPIARLRRFMKVWRGFAELKDDDEDGSYDIFVNCTGIALEPHFGEKFENDLRGKGKEVLSTKYKDYLEEVLDIDTIYVVFEACAGMKLNDPNLMAAVARIQEDGTN